MPFFKFNALNSENQMVTGVVEAETESAAIRLVKDESLEVVSIAPRRVGITQINIDFFQRVSPKDIVIMSRQLSTMVDATLPLVKALNILVKQTSNPKLKGIVSQIADDVEGGAKLSDAFAKFPKLFTDFYLSIIKSGETTGQLAEVLGYLADQLEKDYDLKSRIRGAMIYPAFIMSSLVGVGALMMIYVVPKMTDILTETGAELPITTRILIFTSDWLVAYWWLALILLVVAAIAFKFSLRFYKFRYAMDWLILRLPVFGPLFKRIYVVRMSQSLGTLSAGKVPLVDALEVVRDIVGNEIYKKLINETIDEVRDGNSIATVFIKSKDVPDMLSQMLTVGEETGRIDDILDRVSKFYSREIDSLVSNLVTLIEPIVMIVMGLAVGVMVSAIILPIYSISTAI